MTGEASRPPAAREPIGRAAAAGPAFRERRLGAGLWMVRDDCLDRVPDADLVRLLAGPAHPTSSGGGGRGDVVALRLGGREAIAKRALHGGLLASILRGLFWGRARGLRAVQAADRLRRRDVATPAVLAAGWRRVLGPFHAHALVTEAVPGGKNLLAALAGRPPAAARRGMLKAAGAEVARMHRAGFDHADLNLANLVVEDREEGPRVFVIDLDGGRFVEPMDERRRRRALRRLLRSWEKWLGAVIPPGPRDAAAFLRAYCGGERREMRRRLADLRSYRQGLGVRRLLWRRSARRVADARGGP